MQIQKFLLTSALYLSLAGGGAAFADDRDGERRATAQSTTQSTAQVQSSADKRAFTEKERANLERYAAKERERRAVEEAHGGDGHEGEKHKQGKHKEGKQKALPPGLQKKVARGGELPPGWQAKLARGEVLPQSVYDAGRPVSPEVRKQYQLPTDPRGTVTLDVDGEIVRVVQDTREIIDILRGKR